MSDELFSGFDEEETASPTTNEESNVIPSEVLSKQDSGYEVLNDDQKIILGDLASHYSLAIAEVIKEFDLAYADKSLNRFNNNRDKKFNLAKAIMKSVLEEKAKVKTYSVMPIGKSSFYAKNANMVISTLVALMEYEKDGKIVKKKMAIRGFDNKGDTMYKSLQDAIFFYNYNPMLKYDEGKDEFSLSEFSSFAFGNPPEGKMANLTDLEIYKGLKIVPHENINKAGLSRIPKGSDYADPTDLKAVHIIGSPVRSYKAPTDFDDVKSVSTQAIDWEGNSFNLYFPSLPEFEAMFAEVPKNERFSGVAIGTIAENKNGNITMNAYNFYLTEDEE